MGLPPIDFRSTLEKGGSGENLLKIEESPLQNSTYLLPLKKTQVFLAPIRSQNGGDHLELVW